jgi:arylsulfatase A
MEQSPNVVLIVADDLGYSDLGAVNGGLSHTPVLDGLLAEGVTLARQYAASPVCAPSRAGLLTGRYPHRTGAVDTMEWWGLDRLALRERTLADLLRANGYRTGLVGKWHLGAFDPRYHPSRRGFDETVCFSGGMQDYWEWRVEWGDVVRRGDGRYLTDVWVEEAAAFIGRHRDEPFFLYVGFNAPHVPLQVPAEEVEPFLGREGVPNEFVATLYGMIRRMDTGIGRLLQALRDFGLEDDTIVVFTSDNGPDFGGRYEGAFQLSRFNGGLNGTKLDVLEGGIRVPAIIRWPAGLTGGRSIDEVVHFTDWLPTLLAMTGTLVPDDSLPLDGVDALSVLRGEGATAERTRPLFLQWNRYVPLGDCNAAVRDGDWKLMRPWRARAWEVPDANWILTSLDNPEHFAEHGIFRPPYPEVPIGTAGAPQLFQVADDPFEQHDLAASEPERVARLGAMLDAWFDEVERERRGIAESTADP